MGNQATAEALRIAQALGNTAMSDMKSMTVVAPNMQVHVHVKSGSPNIENGYPIEQFTNQADFGDDDNPPGDFSSIKLDLSKLSIQTMREISQ